MRKTAFLRTVALCLLAVMCLGSCGGEPMPPAVTTDTPATTEVPATTAAPEPIPEPTGVLTISRSADDIGPNIALASIDGNHIIGFLTMFGI